VSRLSVFCLASKDAVVHENNPPSACARVQGSACARVHMAVTHAKHADIILHTGGNAHAAWHTTCAHMSARAKPRSPRAQQRRSLAGSTGADGCMLCACSLACMPRNVISDAHAAWHAACLRCRRAGPGDRTDARVAPDVRLTSVRRTRSLDTRRTVASVCIVVDL
jgi:hypothetical protein